MSLAGKFLISIPDLTDENFFRSVVLLFRHDGDGAMGLVLNRPTSVRLEEVIEDVAAEEFATGLTETDPGNFLFWGGPVKGPLMGLHSSLALAESSIVPKVQFSVSRDRIRRLVMQSAHPFRLFSGYCGWAPGQLEVEIGAGGWLACPAGSEEVYSPTPARMWHRLCERVGLQIMLAQGGDSDGAHRPGPSDPRLN